MSDKEFYQIIAKELETKNVDTALWIQAKATAEGDADKTEAAYIRLRFLDLKKSSLPPKSTSFVNDNRVESVSKLQAAELSKLRSELAKKLLTQGRKSLYSILNLHADASDTVIAAAIADLESKNLATLGISPAELKYAKDTLSNADVREQYDRQLFGAISYTPKPYNSYSYEDESSEYSWWESRKTSVIIGVLSLILFGYLGINYQKERHTTEIQKETVEVVKDAVHSSSDTEQMRVQADIDYKARTLSLAEERQKQDFELRARAADQALEQQRMAQEARAKADWQRQQAEEQRRQAQQEQAENLRIAKEKQYYACMNRAITPGVTSYDASARCAMYR